MTQLGNERIVGIDVSKDRLDLYDWDSKCPDSIANDLDAIDGWLAGFSLPVRFAIEPTNQYHIALAERAHARGHAVYLVDPHRLSHYRCGVGQRVKADPQDAQLLARYLAREGDDLAPWKPLSQGQQRFWRLLRRRATVVRARIQLQQSLSGLKTLHSDVDGLAGAVQNADQEDGEVAIVGGEKTRMGKGSGSLPGDRGDRPAQRAGANGDLPSAHLP